MAPSPRWAPRALALLALVAGFWAPLVAAQGGGAALVASGLVNPRGMAWDADGALYVALAGSGGDQPDRADAGEQFFGGLTGSVALIDDGCAVPIADNLPSARGESGRVRGPAALAVLGGRLYLANDGGGPAHGNPDHPSGVYVIDSNGGWALVGNLAPWMADNPVANPPANSAPGAEPAAMLADGQSLLVAERAEGQLLRVGVDGSIARVVDLSAGDGGPAGLARDASGNLYVGGRTTDPDGAAVLQATPDGAVNPVWTGLGTVADVAIAPDGTRYALELAAGDADDPLAARNSGRIVRQTGPNTAQPVATGLDLPAAMAFGPDGGLYVSYPLITAPGETGGILRVDPDAPGPIAVDPARLGPGRCAPTTGPATGPGAAAAATPEATDDAADGSEAAAGATAVRIADFAFAPATLQVAAGATVTWTNDDAAPHTATAADRSFDSGNLNPGDSFSHTFADPGTYDYLCSYHAGMKGTIVVE